MTTTWKQLSAPLRLAITAPSCLLAILLGCGAAGMIEVKVDPTTRQPANTTVNLAGSNWTGTLDAARLPALAPLLSGGAGTLNLSGYSVSLPAAAVTAAIAGANIAPGSVTTPGGQTTNSPLKVGTLEFQPFALNSAWIGENVYFDGTVFRNRAAGAGGLVSFQGNEIQLQAFSTHSASTNVGQNVQFKASSEGVVGIGGAINPGVGNFTGATLVVDGSDVTMNGLITFYMDGGMYAATGDPIIASDGTIYARGDGVLLFSPNGNPWQLKVDNSGTLSVVAYSY